jgi:predicted metal-dependent hydrolase
MGHTTDSERKIPTRRISFEASLQDLPKHFGAGGDLIPSDVAASLSAVFPDGEDFFVRSVRHFRSRA